MSTPPSLLQRLTGRTVASFRANDVGQRCFVVRSPDPSRFAPLASFDVLERLLETHRFGWPRLRLAHRGEALPEAALYRRHVSKRGESIPKLQVAALQERLAEGATLVLDAIDEAHPPIRALVQQLETELKETIQANAYAAWSGDSQAFALHWDREDVLILQVAGTKRWEVRGPSKVHPTREDLTQPTTPPEAVAWTGTLQPGDVLHIPRGWWHRAWPTGEPTLHLTLGIRHRTWLDVLDWLTTEAQDAEFFRSDVVANGDWAGFSDAMGELLDRHRLEDFWLAHDAVSEPRPRVSLPQPGPLQRVRWCGARHTRLVHHPGQDHFSLGASGEIWDFEVALMPLFGALVQRPLTLAACAELAPSLDAEALDGLLRDLVDDGLLRPG